MEKPETVCSAAINRFLVELVPQFRVLLTSAILFLSTAALSQPPCLKDVRYSFEETGDLYVGIHKCDTLTEILYFANGNLSERVTRVNGELDGKWEEYWDNGCPKRISHWKMGVREDTAFFFYRNGQLEQRFQTVSGKVEGEVVEYYHNGKRRQRGFYRKDKMVGIWEEYTEDGSLKWRGRYRNNKRVGKWE